ncbi:MAG TPA: alpha/beta fold hydrolase [Allosphingosinicella sp.]
MKRLAAAALLLAAAGCVRPAGPPPATGEVSPRTLDLFDEQRGRAVPLRLYGSDRPRSRPLAIISHGYGGTSGAYSFIAEALVQRGYFVVSIQHELPGDAPMPTEGEPQVVRRPFWERGAGTIDYVIDTFRGNEARRTPVLLIGHSNGGDMSMLYAARRPERVSAVFSLDSRRFPFPRTRRPRICSARSSDQAADPGVLPSPDVQARLGMVIERVPVIHNDMWNGASTAQKAAMLAVLERCLVPPHREMGRGTMRSMVER